MNSKHINSESQSTKSARDLVIACVVKRAKRYPDFDIKPMQTENLDSRDAGLARAIDQAVARHWLAIAALIESCLDRPWDRVQPELQAIFLVGGAQLIFLDRIPDHAAVNHAVEWTKRNIKLKASGFVNAVLHSLIRLRGEPPEIIKPDSNGSSLTSDTLGRNQLPMPDGSVLTLTKDVFEKDEIQRLGQQTSHPEALVVRWVRSMGKKRTRELCMHNLVHAPLVVTEVGGKIDTVSSHLIPHKETSYAIFEGSHTELLAWLAESPNRRVQDAASSYPALLTLGSNPGVIVDVCAGKGTKTHQLAELHPDAEVYATDVDGSRMKALTERFKNMDKVKVLPFGELASLNGKCDLVVLDVPCSNTGVLARRVEARYRCNGRSIEQLVSIQRQIVADSLLLRSDAGRLLYATCSLEEEENEQQIAWIEKWHPLKMVKKVQTWPTGLPGDNPASYADGGFAVMLGSAS